MSEGVVAASEGHRVEPMVGQCLAKETTGGEESVEENVVGIVHLIDLESSLQAALVKSGVMGDKGNARHVLRPI